MKPTSLLALPLAFTFLTSANAAPTPKTLSAAATQQMVDRVLKETSAIRGLSIKRAVPSGIQSTAGVEKMIKSQIQDQMSEREAAAAEIFLKQLGLASANFNLKSYYVKMLGEQIAGYYEPKTKKFYTTEHVDAAQLETVMSHELTHALQDQHFDLGSLEKWPKHDSDARLAMTSLVEGDATFTMARYATASPLRALSVLASALKPQPSSEVLNAGPKILRESLTFPYLQGMQFAGNLFKEHGFDSISGAFTRRPQSTEQILHFDKYLAREAPVKVPLRDLTTEMGAGWTLLDHDVNGEMGLRYIVGEHLKDETRAQSAAAGWAGDRFSVYRGPKGGDLVVQDLRFDTAKDALEWQQAYAKSRTNRFGKSPVSRGAVQIWNAAPNGVWMEKRGARVLILEGTVGAFNADSLLKVLWR